MTKSKYGEEVREEVVETAVEKRAREEAELKAKEPVNARLLRLVGALRGGRIFGADRKAAYEELEEIANGLGSDVKLVVPKEEAKTAAEVKAEEKAEREKEREAEKGHRY